MSAAGASGKSFTIGAAGAQTPCTRPTGCLRTRSCLLTPRQQHQILVLFASDCHVALEVTWSVYQNIIDAYRDPNKVRGKALMQAEINTLTSTRVPRGLSELITLGRTLKRRSRDTLPTSTTPTPAMALLKPSTAALNTYAALPSGSETSPTTSPEHSSKQEDSDPNYTPNYEEPVIPTSTFYVFQYPPLK